MKTSPTFAQVNGVELYYEIHGEGAPLVLLHGGVNPSEMFGAPLQAMAKSHRVIALHLQGHGLSKDSDRPWSYENSADDAYARNEIIASDGAMSRRSGGAAKATRT